MEELAASLTDKSPEVELGGGGAGEGGRGGGRGGEGGVGQAVPKDVAVAVTGAPPKFQLPGMTPHYK